MSFFRKKRALLLLLFVFLLLLFFTPHWYGKWIYPIHYRDDIKVSAMNYGVNPHLITAIIRVESNFKPDVQSKKGALGIMQLMPDTANWIVESYGYSAETKGNLTRADVNIELGAKYLQILSQQFGRNELAVVAAYNAGQGNVSKWLDEGIWDGRLETVDRIPFGETRHYVQRVMYYYNRYQSIYPEF